MSVGFSAHGSRKRAGGWIGSGDVRPADDSLNLPFAYGAAFASPAEVLASANLTRDEKRTILASWAFDIWAVESAPALRLCPFGVQPVEVDDVLAALRDLDGQPPESEAGTGTIRGRVQPARGRPLGVMRRRVLH